MIDSRQGSPDGIKVQWYREGQEYDLPLSLAEAFINDGTAVDVNAEVPLETPKREYKPKFKKAS